MAQKTEERPLWPRAPVSEDPRELRNWAQALTKQLTQVFQQMGYRANTTVPKDGSEEANINILPDSSIIADKLTQGAQSFSTDIDFSATDQNTVAWTAGTITFADGSSHSINGGNTGDMAAATFIYLDTDVSETELQTSTTFSDVVGDNKKLLCYAQVAPTANQNAFFLPAIGSFNANTDQLSVDRLSALTADMGELTAGVVRDANSRFVLDLDSVLQTIADNQDTPIDRVKIGQLGGGNADYGIEVYDSNGDLILGATGLGVDVVDTVQVINRAITDAYALSASGQETLTSDLTTSKLILSEQLSSAQQWDQNDHIQLDVLVDVNYSGVRTSGSSRRDEGFTLVLHLLDSGGNELITGSGLSLVDKFDVFWGGPENIGYNDQMNTAVFVNSLLSESEINQVEFVQLEAVPNESTMFPSSQFDSSESRILLFGSMIVTRRAK